jgi:hypothetical protein
VLNVINGITVLSAWYGQSINHGGLDVTSLFCKQITSFINFEGPITVNNALIGTDPTPGLAKSFFVQYNLASSPGKVFTFWRGPSIGEGYQIALQDLRDAANGPAPGTITGSGRTVKVLYAYWAGYFGSQPSSWTPDVSTWPAGWDVTGTVWTMLSANNNQGLGAMNSVFGGDPAPGMTKKLIMAYQMDEGAGFGSRVGVYAAPESTATVTAANFPSLAPKFQILEVWYGATSDTATAHGAWVTDILIKAFKLSDTFLINNSNLGGDPAVNQLKTFILSYLSPLDNFKSIKQLFLNLPAGENVWISVKDLP